jgi:hypothetical protein
MPKSDFNNASVFFGCDSSNLRVMPRVNFDTTDGPDFNSRRFPFDTGLLHHEGKITIIATLRSSRVSRARYTSPMPPAPSGD